MAASSATATCRRWPTQGVPLKALQWMFQDDGPLRFRPEADLRQWRWLAKFLANCNADRQPQDHRQAARTGRTVAPRDGRARSSPSRSTHFAWRDAGKLVVYRTKQSVRRGDRQARSGRRAPGAVARPNASRANRRWRRRSRARRRHLQRRRSGGRLPRLLPGAGRAPRRASALSRHHPRRGAPLRHRRRQGHRARDHRRPAVGRRLRAGRRHPEPRPGRQRRHLSAAVPAQGLQPDGADPRRPTCAPEISASPTSNARCCMRASATRCGWPRWSTWSAKT